jgi:hypothetical protein
MSCLLLFYLLDPTNKMNMHTNTVVLFFLVIKLLAYCSFNIFGKITANNEATRLLARQTLRNIER